MNEEFGAVLVAGLTIFGLAFVIDQGVGGDVGELFSAESTPDRLVYAQENPGTVGRSNPDHRTVDFGSFTVGEARGDIRAYERRQKDISDKLFGGESIKFDYNATQPREGSLSFEVLGRDGRGAVYVKVNGQQVFSEYLVSTGAPEIEIPSENLKRGINSIEIGVNRQSFLGSSKYSLEDIEFLVNDRKFHDYQDDFRLYQYELEDYVESPLTFSITESVKTSPLEVYINDNRVYSKAQVRADEEVEVNPQNADLDTGANTIRFETDRAPAEYAIENAQMTMRYVGNSQGESVVRNFAMNDSALEYAEREDTTEYITFQYQNLLPSPREMRIQLNDFTTTLTPVNGRNRVNFSSDDLEDTNLISIQSRGTYQMNNLRIESVREE